MELAKTLTFNIGGKKEFTILQETLARYPDTCLGALARRWEEGVLTPETRCNSPSNGNEERTNKKSESNLDCKKRKRDETFSKTNFNPSAAKGNKSNPIFFDRNPEIFSYILQWYRNLEISIPITVSKRALMKEVEFFNLPLVESDIIVDRPPLINRKAILEYENKKLVEYETNYEYHMVHAAANMTMARLIKRLALLTATDRTSEYAEIQYCDKFPATLDVGDIERLENNNGFDSLPKVFSPVSLCNGNNFKKFKDVCAAIAKDHGCKLKITNKDGTPIWGYMRLSYI